MAISDYSTTAASNGTIGGIDVSGATGKVKDGDNVMRQMAADMKAGLITGYTTTATAAGTTTLTVASNSYQYFTGTTTQTVVMPVTSTLELGRAWVIVNNSTGALTVNSSGGNLIATIPPSCVGTIQCILLTGTSAASWFARTSGERYSEGTFTPVLTFATAGNLSVTYSDQIARYTKIGRLVTVEFRIETSAFTHTTASGALQITGCPFTALNDGNNVTGALQWAGITKASYTNCVANIGANTSTILVNASGSGQAVANITASDMPTGGAVKLRGTLTFAAQ